MATKVYKNLEKSVLIGDESLTYYDLEGIIDPAKYARLPYSIRILLESAVRNCDNFQVSEEDVRFGLKISRAGVFLKQGPVLGLGPIFNSVKINHQLGRKSRQRG